MARIQKISIVGVGHVGEASALALAQADLCWELALMARDPDRAHGVASDIRQSAPVFGFDTSVVHLSALEDLAGSDIVILSAGLPRQPGMSRSDLLESNRTIVRPVAEAIGNHCPGAILIVVTNPVDVMTYYAWRVSGLPRNRVIGLAGVLDSSRMAFFIAEEAGVSVQDVNALVIGGHGDHMLPLTQIASIGGVPLPTLLEEDVLEKIVERTRNAGTEILKLRKTGTSFHAPAAAIWKMVDAIVGNRFRLLPVTSVLEGEYGLGNIAMGVPCILNASGISKIVELELDEKDRSQLEESARTVAADIERLPF
ncbi:malate dehydrogenase [Kaarinaea lacus]